MEIDQQRELDRWNLLDWSNPDASYDGDYKSEARFAVIGACGRSGTTLLRAMLGVHSQILTGSETSVFLPNCLDLSKLARRVRIDYNTIITAAQEAPVRGCLIEKLQQILAATSQKPLWIDKTSRNIHCFQYIRRHFPNALLIHVLRDPRDVVMSLRTHPIVQREDSARKVTGWLQPWEECVARWRRSVKDGICMRGDSNYCEVRYEDLIQSQKSTLQNLCAFLDVRFEEQMLEHYAHIRPGDVDHVFIPNNKRAVSPIDASRVNRWCREMPTDVAKLVNDRLADLASEVGYALS